MKNVSQIATLIFAIFSVVSLEGCGKAHSNMQTLHTGDCGVNWKLISPGETVPSTVGTCSYRVDIPDYQMPGDTRFKVTFLHKAVADVEISYEYEIDEPMKFIQEAKFLGSQGATDDQVKLAAQFEQAENSIIDKTIREETTSLTQEAQIDEFDQAKFEKTLQDKINGSLKPRGVHLKSMTFVLLPGPQTQLAIDTASAMKVYASNGLTELGQKMAIARAGAATVNVTNVMKPEEGKK